MIDRKAFRSLSSGLYLITAKAGDARCGCVVNTLVQVASEPATLSVSLNKENATTAAILTAAGNHRRQRSTESQHGSAPPLSRGKRHHPGRRASRQFFISARKPKGLLKDARRGAHRRRQIGGCSPPASLTSHRGSSATEGYFFYLEDKFGVSIVG